MMSCGVASWLPHAVAETLRGHRSAAPLAAWLTGIRAAPEEYDPLVLVAAATNLEPEEEDPGHTFDGILSQLGRDIFQLEQYQRNLYPPDNEDVSLSILNIFDECLGEIVQARATDDANSDNCEPSECENVNQVEITNGDVEPTIVPLVNGCVNGEEDFSDCASTATLSDASFVTSTPAKICEKPCDNKMFDNTRPPPVPPRRVKPRSPSISSSAVENIEIKSESTDIEAVCIDSDRDSVSTCWSYKDCSADENDNTKDQYAVVWSHSSGFHNSDEILRKVLSQNHATVSQLSFDTASEFAPSNFSVYALPEAEVGDRCAGDDAAASVAVMTAGRPTDDGYEPVRDALATDENIYEEIEYSYSYTDEGCSCGGSVEVESCSISASSEGAGRESPVYANLRDHDAYAIPPDVIAWKNLLLDPYCNEDEEDEWITPEECAVYSREQRPPLVIPRITQFRPRHVGSHAYPEDVYLEPKPRGYNRLDASPRSERNVGFASPIIGSDGPPYPISKRLGGSTENLLTNQLRRPTNLQLPASSSGDSLDYEVRAPVAPRNRKSRSMVAPKERMRSPIPAPRVLVNQPVEAAVVSEGIIKRTKFSESGKKCKKNWTECYMLLTQTALVFYKDLKTYNASRIPKTAGTPPSPCAARAELVLPLQNAHIVHCIQMHTRRYQRSLLLTVNYDHYLLQDETEDGAKRWLNRIQNIIFQLGPPSMEEHLTPHYQSSSTDLESLGRTPPVARHNKGKQKGGSSNEDLTESAEGSIKKSHVTSRLLKFFARRPPMEVLVKKGIYKDEPVFGQNLEAVCPAESPRVPDFVVEVIREIEGFEENMTTDGLYRASGNLSQIQKIRLEIDQKNLSVIKNNPDIHVLTGSLKLFFRELKEPLIPCSVFDRVLAACSIKPKEARTREFRDIVQSLPQCNRETLKFLLEHLLRVTQYSEKNRMHTANLAIVFGPTLLWAPAAQAHNIAVDCIQQNNVVDILLTDFKEIFQEDKGKKKA